MQITCPKCQKPIELMETISLRDADGLEDKTHIAEGLICPDCGLIPFDYLGTDREKVRISASQETVAHFRLLRPLGQGGFGVVWLAKDITLDRMVALKMPVANRSSVSDLLYEAQNAAKLRHPNIVSIFETGQTEKGQAFIASDYIDGLNLKDVLSAGRPTLDTTIALMVTISDALHHAHQMGIVHRDIKPANIMIDKDGVPYVADFGLAKRVSEESGSTSGSIVGTAHYMSPEQSTGQEHMTDHRADLYAVGVMLFQMLTGELPFRGNTQAVIYQKSRQDAPSPRLLRPSIPKDLETLCLKCLERDPDKRYPSALILKQEFQRVQRGEEILARPVGPIEKAYRLAKRFPTVTGLSLGLVASLVAGIIGVTFFWQDALNNARIAHETTYRSQMSLVAQQYVQGDLEGIRTTLDRIDADSQLASLKDFSWNYYDQLLDTFSLTVNHGDQIEDLAISNDQRLLATVGFDGYCVLWKTESGERLARVRPGEHHYRSVAFSPTRLQLATGDSNGQISIWNPNNMEIPLKSISHGPRVKTVRYAWDGKSVLAFGEQGAVRVWDIDSEETLQQISAGPQGANAAIFSHDGTQVAIGGDQGILRIWSVADGSLLKQIKNGDEAKLEPIQTLSYSQDDSKIAVGGGFGRYRIYDVKLGKVITENHTLQGKIGTVAFVQNDQLLAITGTTRTLDVYDLQSGQVVVRYSTHRLGEGLASLSYDGRSLAVGSGDGTVKILKVPSFREPNIAWHTSPVRAIRVSEDGGSALAMGENGEVRRFDLRSGEAELLLEATKQGLQKMGIDSRQNRLFRGVPEPTIEFVDLDPGKRQVKTLATPFRALAGMSVDSRTGKLFVLSRSGELLQYDSRKLREPEQELTLEADAKNTAIEIVGAESADWLAVGFMDGRIVILTQQPLKVHRTIETDGEAAVFAFNRDSLIVGMIYGDLHVYDLSSATDSKPRRIEGHGAEITAVIPFPDGASFATGSRDHIIKIWDTNSGDEITSLYGHDRQVFSLAISPDARTLVSGGLQGDLHIWRTTRE